MKQLLFAALMTLSISCMANLKKSSLDSLRAIAIANQLGEMKSKIHNAYLQGDIAVYKNDSLNSELTVERFQTMFEAMPQMGQVNGFIACVRLKSNFTSFDQESEVYCIAPVYELVIDGVDLGNIPMYYVAMKDVKKVLNENEVKLLAVLTNLAEKNYSNNIFSESSLVVSGDDYRTIEHGYQMSYNMSDWAYGRQNIIIKLEDLREICKNAIEVFEESLNTVLCNTAPNMSCYLDKKFKKEVPHLAKHEPFQQLEVIQLPSPEYPGEFKDTVIRHDCQIQWVYKVVEIKNGYQIDFWGVSIFMKKEDFEVAVPEWVRLLLVEHEL
ncbi:MAG: hypothetical protein JXQ87_11940 [Bacteroidia bacterium]